MMHSFVPRTILYTGVLQKLAQEFSDIIVLVPQEKVIFYRNTYQYKNITFRGVDLSHINHSLITRIRTFFEYGIHTNIKKFHAQKIYESDKNWTLYIIRRAWMNTVGKLHILQHLLRTLFVYAIRNETTGVEGYIDADTTKLVSTDIYNENDLLFIETARRKKIKTIGMVRSWDNNMSKILLPFVPNQILTQNEIQSNELRTIQGVSDSTITAIGMPYYEYCIQYTPTSRDIFMSTVGIPIESKLILFSPAGSSFIDHDWQFCQIMKDAIDCGDLPNNTYVLVRCHPGNPCDLTSFQLNEHFIIERPGTIVDPARGNKGAELDIDATNHLIDELTHSNVVVNILSSIVLDSAVVGTPVVTPQFEGLSQNVPFLKSVQRFQKEENMAMLLNIWNGSRPKTKTAFIEELKRILQGDIASDSLALKRIMDNYNILPETKNESAATQSLHNILSKD